MSKLIFPKGVSPQWYQEYIDNHWMGLGDTSKLEVVNPFSLRTKDDVKNPHMFVLDLMRRPEYFFFTCKHLLNKTLAPFQLAILKELWIRPFPMLIGSRGLGKSFLLALYSVLRATFCQGSKIVIVGAAFRQAKGVFDYCQEIWDNAPILRDLAGSDKRNGPRRDVDRCTLRIGDSIVTALPLGDGTKIRGMRANVILADEMASIPVDIFETVVRGFAAVSMDPIIKLQREARIDAMRDLGVWTEEEEDAIPGLGSNQTICSGTCFYSFNHFYDYWKRYKSIVESKGDKNKLSNIFNGEIPSNFNWRDYSVIRIPYTSIPKGFMDDKQIAQAKATVHTGIFQMEYGACFATDSNGFFKRSLIESCVVGKPASPIVHNCGEVTFSAVLKGQPNRKYVIGVDPASENDNFSIVVLECHEDHRRIVHCWTTNRSRFKAQQKHKITDEQDYYRFAAKKIRELNRLFPAERIALDSQGGGVAVLEALGDTSDLKGNEQPFYEIVDPDKPKDSDGKPGLHIIELINFAKADWVSEANHGMRKDFEDKTLLFPMFDSVTMGLAIEEDRLTGRVKVDQKDASVEKLYDTLEDCVMEIEDLKDELTSIVHTQTGTSMRDRWDTPETKQAGGKKGRLRKDRYSALLMANMVGRVLQRTPTESEYQAYGGFANVLSTKKDKNGFLYTGPDWYVRAANEALGGFQAIHAGKA